MLRRLFGRSRPVKQTIERPRENARASRWAAAPRLGRKVRVVAVDAETPDAVTVTLQPVDGQPLAFKAGQYLTHCLNIDGQEVRRAYSLSVPEGSAELAYTCKAVSDGLASRYICEQLKPGDEYEVRGPSGDFTLVDGDAPLLLVAAGSGITPLMSLLETALQRLADRPVTLLYGSRDESHIIFSRRLEALQAAHANLRVVHVLSRPGDAWSGEQGHIDGERMLALAAPAPESHLYLCGPQAMMDDCAAAWGRAGLPVAHLHREDFRSVNHAAVAHSDTPQPIVFARSGRQIEQQPGQSILDAALANDIAVEFSCTVGGCAACKVKILKGRVALDEPNCLEEAEREQGYTLACSAYALEPLELDA